MLDEDRRQLERFRNVIEGMHLDVHVFESFEGVVHLKQVAGYLEAATSLAAQEAEPGSGGAAAVLMDGLIEAS